MSKAAERYWRDAKDRVRSMTPDEAERFVRRAPDFDLRTYARCIYWRNQIQWARDSAQAIRGEGERE